MSSVPGESQQLNASIALELWLVVKRLTTRDQLEVRDPVCADQKESDD